MWLPSALTQLGHGEEEKSQLGPYSYCLWRCRSSCRSGQGRQDGFGISQAVSQWKREVHRLGKFQADGERSSVIRRPAVAKLREERACLRSYGSSPPNFSYLLALCGITRDSPNVRLAKPREKMRHRPLIVQVVSRCGSFGVAHPDSDAFR